MRIIDTDTVLKNETINEPIRVTNGSSLTLIECDVDAGGYGYGIQANQWRKTDTRFEPVGALKIVGGSVQNASSKLLLAHRFICQKVHFRGSDQDAIFVDKGRNYWIDECTFEDVAQKKDFDPTDPQDRPHGEAIQDQGGIDRDDKDGRPIEELKTWGFISRNKFNLGSSSFANSCTYFEAKFGPIRNLYIWENAFQGGQYGLVAKDEPPRRPSDPDFGYPRFRMSDNEFEKGSFGSGPTNIPGMRWAEAFGNRWVNGEMIPGLS